MDSIAVTFVTGGTGFIGSRLVQKLADCGSRVRVLVRRMELPRLPGTPEREGHPLKRKEVDLVQGDVTDAESVVRAMAGCRRVYHLAGYAKNWARDPGVFERVNVEGARNVFQAARQMNIERIVWTSTIMTLGPTPPSVVGTEQMPRITDRFFSDYDRTKSLAEAEAVRQASEGLPLVVVNPTRVFGPGYLTEGNALSLLIRDYMHGRVPVLLNRGVNVGNYVLVDDVVEGLVLAMEKGRVGQRYIMGGDNVSLREFFRTIDHVSGQRHFQIPLRTVMPMVFAYLQKKRAEWFGIYPRITPGWVRVFLVDWVYSSQKAETELGYRRTPLEDGIRITYQWLQRVHKESS